jgi:hypothetical protein
VGATGADDGGDQRSEWLAERARRARVTRWRARRLRRTLLSRLPQEWTAKTQEEDRVTAIDEGYRRERVLLCRVKTQE